MSILYNNTNTNNNNNDNSNNNNNNNKIFKSYDNRKYMNVDYI